MSDDQIFHYLPLSNDNSEIRLLRIHPARLDDDVTGQLETVVQASAPAYRTLSYTWGGLSQVHRILLNGKRFAVTENLLAALKQLRDDVDELVIWIDAICINQNGADNERNDQVSKMRSIYEGASEVLVWLGVSSPTSSLAFSYIREMTALLAVQGNVNNFIGDPEHYEGLVALHTLLQRDYWKRMWVIQETCVAQNITVHCGSDSTAWDQILATQDALVEHEPAMVTLAGERNLGMTILNQLWTSGPQAMKAAGPEITRSREPTLHEALLYHSPKLCSFPIDRVYSIVGLTSARFDSRFKIDYSRNLREVFTDVARYTIVSSKALEIICALIPAPGSRDLTSSQLPSWVPDWAAPDPYVNSLGGRESAYTAAGTTTAEPEFSSDGKALFTKGFIVSTVAELGVKTGITSPWDKNNEDIPNLIRAIYSWRNMLRTSDANIPNPLHDMFRDTITCAIVYNRFFAGWTVEKYLEELMGLYGMLCRQHHPELVLDPHWESLADNGSSWESDAHRQAWAQTAILDNKRVLFRRRFFLADGNLTGVAHEDVRVGDKICILYGIHTPVILRLLESGYYTLVGETFVSGRGYMFGTALGELATGKHIEETFEIH